MPWDGTAWGGGQPRGQPPWGTPPGGGGLTFDAAWRDATGAFLIGELERLDQTLHMPLYTVTWGRDIDIREDVTVADEVSSFTNSSFAAAGGISPTGISWIGKDVNTITGAQVDIGKTPQPLFLWGMELSYTMPELESAMQVGRPIDDQKFQVIRVKHQMDIDNLVYVGDPTVGSSGLCNHPLVTNVANATTGNWSTVAFTGTVTPLTIMADVNNLLNSVWQASGWAQMPDQLRVPPTQFGILVNTPASQTTNVSLLRYLQENSLCNTQNGRPLNIQPLKWLPGIGVGATNRMIAYTKAYDRVRFPMTPLNRTPLEWRSIYNIVTYWGRLGMLEVVYPETIGYRDGI